MGEAEPGTLHVLLINEKRTKKLPASTTEGMGRRHREALPMQSKGVLPCQAAWPRAGLVLWPRSGHRMPPPRQSLAVTFYPLTAQSEKQRPKSVQTQRTERSDHEG